jgi:hypothetical protein
MSAPAVVSFQCRVGKWVAEDKEKKAGRRVMALLLSPRIKPEREHSNLNMNLFSLKRVV